jgi:hypothetical protein
MVEVARTRAARDKVAATFDVHDVSAPLRFVSGMSNNAFAYAPMAGPCSAAMTCNRLRSGSA